MACFLACACGDGGRVEPSGSGVGSAVTAPVTSAPHEAAIDLIAVTSTGDAALTADENDSVRLWPTLDGTHEPVVVRFAAPIELALGRDEHGFIAAARDEAGGIQLARFDRAGRLRDRTLVTAEPGYAQIIAVRDHILGRRRDHVVVQLAGDGRVTGTLAAPPGEQLATLVTRNDHVIAAILAPPDAPTESRTGDEELPVIGLRRLARDRLAWGDSIALAKRTTAMLAISPTGNRMVAIHERNAVFFDLTTGREDPPQVGPMSFTHELASGGAEFLDDDHVVLFGAKVVPWEQREADPAKVNTPGSLIERPSVLAVGGNVIAGPHGTGLQLARADGTTRWLGYAALGPGRALHTLGSSIQLELPFDLMWLDRQLRATRIVSTPRTKITTLRMRDDQPFVLDDNHVLESNGPGAGVKIRDLVTNEIVDLGSGYDHITDVAYEPVSSVLAIVTSWKTYQMQVDLKRGTTERLPSFETVADSTIVLTDRSTGIAAVAVSASEFTGEALISDGQIVATFPVESDGGEPAGPSSKIKVPGRVIGIDRTGSVYVSGDQLHVFRNGKPIARFPGPFAALVGAVRKLLARHKLA